MMESPPKAFGSPIRKCKRHKSNNYNSFGGGGGSNNWTATENPQINYSSPPRKKSKQNYYNSAPQHFRHRVVVSNHNHEDNDINNNQFSSPISRRYHSRIGTSLYNDDPSGDNNNNNNNNLMSPIRTRKRKYFEQSSPISPTFKQINYSSPSRRNSVGGGLGINNGNNMLSPSNFDRYTPNHGNINRYNLHSPTKRFVHNNNKNMMSYTNVIAPSPKKRRKLGQNYSGTNDDPSSLNHRIKQKLSQHTYNQVLQSELLGFAAEHTNIVNQVFNKNDNNDDTQKNDNISQIQHDYRDDDDETNNNNNNNNNNNPRITSILGSPSLPNRRTRTTPRRNSSNDNNSNNISHHPLCPCFNNQNNDIMNRNDEQSINSEESGNGQGETTYNDNDDLCVCDSITSNVATNFLVSPQRTLRYNVNDDDDQENVYNNGNDAVGDNMRMTPIKPSSQSKLGGSRKCMRNIAKSPFKVLDAPRLTDDFYLNLVDWSGSCNVLSVGLGECVYLWSAFTSKVTKLTDLTKLFEQYPTLLDGDEYNDGYDMVCSVGWSKNHESALSNCSIIGGSGQYGNHNSPQRKPSSTDYLAVGSGSGYVFIFDTVKSKLSRSPLTKHNHRVGVISWKDNNILSSGSRDRNIYLRDIRCNDNNTDIIQQLLFHKQEVCGLKWSEDSLYLASGGNDNKLAIWDIRYNKYNKPLCFGKHKAAVKAITWSPHESGLIASGGGTADRCIKFWNINQFITSSNKLNNKNRRKINHSSAGPSLLKPISVIDTGSQVCNLLWSKNVNEIVSTHGYSLNQIVVWKYPTMDKIVTLTGHTYRVLYLAGSPDGQTVVTGAGDETLRLWSIFPPTPQNGNDNNYNNNFVPQTYSIPLHIR